MIRKTAVGVLSLLLLCGVAAGDGPPTRVRGSQFDPQTANNIPSGKAGIYQSTDGKLYQQNASGAVLPASNMLGYFDVRDYGARCTNTYTTGSMSGGSATLTVASSTGLNVGDYVAVSGADTGAEKLGAKILTKVGTTLTLDTLAQQGVSGVVVERDDQPAFGKAFDAASTFSDTYATRFGTVFLPPCAAGKSYNFATPFARTMTQSGAGTGSANTVRVLGSGLDGPIRVSVGRLRRLFEFINSAGEWNQYFFDYLAFIGPDLTTYGVAAVCTDVMSLSAVVGKVIARDIIVIGVWGKNSIIRLVGNAKLQNFADAGNQAGYDPGNGFIILLDQPTMVEVDNVFSFGEFAYLGYDNNVSGLGAALGLVGINASTDASWGPSVVTLRNINSSSRTDYVVDAYPASGTPEGSTLTLENFRVNSGQAGGVLAAYWRTVIVRDGSFGTSGTARFIVDAYSVDKVVIANVDKGNNGDLSAKVRADSASTLVEIRDTPLASVTGAPSGVLLDNATSTKAFVTSSGVRARIRQAQGTVAANTLGKSGSSDGKVDQLGTGDDARLVTGVILDAGSADDFVRVAELDGQEVQIKSDGAGALAPGDILTASGASAGRVKKTTTGGASTVGLSVATVSASANALVNTIFHRSQY